MWRVGVAGLVVAVAACASGVRGEGRAPSPGTPGAGVHAGRAAPSTTEAAPRDAAARFFVSGDGSLTIQSVHSGDRTTVRYRRADDTYDQEAVARVARVLRSRDGTVGPVSLRFLELLARVQALDGGAPLRVLSGYRSPAYNDGLRARGRKAASASLHTEGMAADLAFARERLGPLWHEIRGLDCCGAGLYAAQGFMHVDVGPSRFWEAHTSRVDENLSAGNARLFARTEFDRHAAGEAIVVSLHAVTVPPVWIARTARLEDDGGRSVGEAAVGAADGGDGPCLEADARTRLRVTGTPAVTRGRLVLATCEPRVERTPLEVRTNPIAVR